MLAVTVTGCPFMIIALPSVAHIRLASRCAFNHEPCISDLAADALGYHMGVIQQCVGQHQHEFFTAVAPNHVARAELVVSQRNNALQHHIA